MYRSAFQSTGPAEAPDYVYYNASVLNNSTNTTSNVRPDPQVRFQEIRDAPLIYNSGDYHFSILRIAMNGVGRDLPIFIPQTTGIVNSEVIGVDPNTGKDIIELSADVNETVYGLAFSYEQIFSQYVSSTVSNDVIVRVAPPPRFVIYEPETVNSVLAPLPSEQSIIDGNPQDLSTRYYWVYTYQHWLDLVNKTILNPADLDGSNGYAFTCCWGDTYQAILTAFPQALLLFPTLRAFANYVNPPQIVYDPKTNRFRFIADSDGFGERIQLFVPALAVESQPVVFRSPPVARMFLNDNMFGLFANVNNVYYNSQNPKDSPFRTLPASILSQLDKDANTITYPTFNFVTLPSATVNVPFGYVNEILFDNKFYTNLLDYRISPASGISPLGYVPIGQQKPYWVSEQEYPSTSDLWSPLESIVLTSALLCVTAEYVSPPVIPTSCVVGKVNGFGIPSVPQPTPYPNFNATDPPVSLSSTTVKNGFDPIIADTVIDCSELGAGNWKQSFVYEPKAEFRLSDFNTKQTPINQIDIAFFWKCRLNGILYPLQMFNLSSMSIKCMFKKRNLIS